MISFVTLSRGRALARRTTGGGGGSAFGVLSLPNVGISRDSQPATNHRNATIVAPLLWGDIAEADESSGAFSIAVMLWLWLWL